MIRVTIELLPGGRTEGARILGRAAIANDIAETMRSGGVTGAYTVVLSKWAPKHGETWKSGRVEGFDRVKRGPWDLLYLALRDCVGKRNP